jgi:hypothetical protein
MFLFLSAGVIFSIADDFESFGPGLFALLLVFIGLGVWFSALFAGVGCLSKKTNI